MSRIYILITTKASDAKLLPQGTTEWSGANVCCNHLIVAIVNMDSFHNIPNDIGSQWQASVWRGKLYS